jgi:hypothetical protein
MAHDVFLCYTTRDKPVADAACHALESSGIRCWVASRDIVPGRPWSGAIINAINQSRVFVIIFSSEANHSPQILREVERAVNKGIPIIPFRIEPVLPSEDLEYFLSAPHWLDALTPPLEQHMQRLVESTRAVLSSPVGQRQASTAATTPVLPKPILSELPAAPPKPPPMVPPRSRVRTDLAERKAEVRSLFERWRRPALVASVAGLILYLILFTFVVPKAGLAVAAQRDEAVFSARRLYTELGGPGGPERLELVARDTVFRFLQQVPDSTRARYADWAESVWHWRVHRFDDQRNEAWWLSVSPPARLIAYSRLQLDTASGANLRADQALPIAEAELQKRAPTKMRFVSDSTQRLTQRTDHFFTWARAEPAIGVNADSALRQIRIGVAGDQVSSYREFLSVPPAFLPKSSKGLRGTSIIFAWVLLSALLIFGFILVIRRGRTDELQWETSFLLNLGLLPLVLLGGWAGYLEYRVPAEATADAWAPQFLILVAAAIISAVIWVPCVAVAESVFHEVRPRMNAGLHEVARGRFNVPEVVSAVLLGYPIALCLLAIRDLLYVAGKQLFNVPLSAVIPGGFDAPFPSLDMLMYASFALGAALLLWFIMSIAISMRPRAWLALTVPTVLYVLFNYGYGFPISNAIAGALIVLVLAATAWYTSMLTTMVATLVLFVAPSTMALLRSGNGDFMAAGLLGLGLLILPAILGISARRRLASHDPTTALAHASVS